ncbi:8-oxo-dGDP phosphatase NUDT18 [Silurus meridionalis]|uniref:Nudix hydrolase domain-containing protein n=1 Tax=Silurus meridionalis TaxID=175797 RepID=A0A8T0ARQ5_SILME|nr:8-oxo-dGDP phosphatase NUDT18 [Silurus meridionalis]KAF7694896.1 hypothetical protein HF521_006619 [Silurus meridionalis]
MDPVDKDIEMLLSGEALEVLPDHEQTVTLRKDVCYIVSAVIFNTEGEVLMVQEAKKQCYGRWYLPAGRMEAGESIHKALRREVKEEAGFECQPITMLLVQESGREWIRFTFLAEVTGGSLKTTSEADSESLQARWWDRESPLTLRSMDITRLIDAGLKYRQKPRFPVCNPVNMPCSVVCQRLLLVFSCSERIWLLVVKHAADLETHARLPVIVLEKRRSVTRAAQRLIEESVRSTNHELQANKCGILGVQHDGRVPGRSDGICFNTLLSLEPLDKGAEPDSPPLLDNEKYTWHEVTDQSLKEKILKRITDKSLLPMYNI